MKVSEGGLGSATLLLSTYFLVLTYLLEYLLAMQGIGSDKDEMTEAVVFRKVYTQKSYHVVVSRSV